MQLTDFECPNCGANDMVASDDQALRCTYCDSTFGEATRICPQCGHYNDHDGRHCAECGMQIVRLCPVCAARNWVLSDHCVQCGRHLDVIDQVVRRLRMTTAERLEQQRAVIGSLKEQEERASQQRMALMLQEERLWQQALAEAQEARRQRDRQIFTLLGVAVAIFVVLVTVLLLVTSLGN